MKFFLLIALALVAFSATGQIYKWYDEHGRARYSEKPPPGVNARFLAPPAHAADLREHAERHEIAAVAIRDHV